MLPTFEGTLHITVWSPGPETCAKNCWVLPRKTVAVRGVTATVVGAGPTDVGDDPQPVTISSAPSPAPMRKFLIAAHRIFHLGWRDSLQPPLGGNTSHFNSSSTLLQQASCCKYNSYGCLQRAFCLTIPGPPVTLDAN